MKIIMTRHKYHKTDSGKSWKSKPYETETKEITREHYENYTDTAASRFMRNLGGGEYVERNYTSMGFVPTRITSTSPDRTEKRVAIFEIQ